MAVKVGCNIDAPTLEVEHAKIPRLEGSDSHYRSECPVCGEGVLLLSRPPGIFALNRHERCTLCGQKFWYTDERVGQEFFLESQSRRLNPDPAPTFWERLQDGKVDP